MCFLKLGVLCDLNSTKLECNILTLLLLYSNFEFEFLICVYLKKKLKTWFKHYFVCYICVLVRFGICIFNFDSFWFL